jgi:hypothetical protein
MSRSSHLTFQTPAHREPLKQSQSRKKVPGNLGRACSVYWLFLSLCGVQCHHVPNPLSKVDANPFFGEEIDEQRAGDTVTCRLRVALTLLVLLYIFQVDVEQVGRVERTSLCFRVELGREDRSGLVNQT